MDTETYDQTFIPASLLGEQKRFLKEGNLCKIMFLEGNAIAAELPLFIIFKVSEAEPVLVPLFVNAGDVLKIDTRTGKYLERVSRGWL